MRTYNFLMWAVLLALLVAGCTAEPLYDNQNTEPSDLIDQNNFTAKTGNDEFTFTGYGDLKVIKRLNSNCGQNDLDEVACEGTNDSDTYGRFKTVAQMCTDWGDVTKIDGRHIFENGDILNFYSMESGVDKFGRKWHMFMYTGGTGMFDGATGSVKVYDESALISTDIGYYTHEGTGILIRDK